MCWWTGENLLDVAVYINDARSLTLTLLGGHTGAEVEGHDWEHILELTGLTMHDHQIAWTAHTIGGVMMVAALVWGAGRPEGLHYGTREAVYAAIASMSSSVRFATTGFMRTAHTPLRVPRCVSNNWRTV
jgi:hypothetical protein